MRMNPLVGVLCLSLLLISCSSNDTYLHAKTLPPIAVPDGLDKQALGQTYRVPESDGRVVTGELTKPLPPTLSARQVVTEPRVQNSEGKSWLVVPKQASATWSQLIIYLQSRRVSSIKQDPYSATIQTGWVIESAEPGTALRYKLSLKAGLQPDLTEIHAVNIQGEADKPTQPLSQWREVSDSRTHEVWLLKEIAKAMSQQKSLGDSLIASSISFPPRIVSTNVAGEPVLDISASKGRAFTSVTNSLESDFVVYEKKVSDGIFYINEAKKDKGEKKKFTEKLKSFLNKISTAKLTKQGLVTSSEASYSLEEILSNLPNEAAVNELFPESASHVNKELSNVSGYLLLQRTLGNNKQRLYIRDGYGRPLDVAEAKSLLDTIRKQLF